MNTVPIFITIFDLVFVLSFGQLVNLHLSFNYDEIVENYINQHKWNQDLMQSLVDDYEIVYPFQTRDQSRVGIDTRNHYYSNTTIHFEKCSFVLRSSYGRFKLHVELNNEILQNLANFGLHYNESHKLDLKGKNVTNCFYQGFVHGENDSSVAISTCSGLQGVIIISNHTYFIIPMKGGDLGKKHPHVLVRAKWHHKVQCANNANTEWGSRITRSLELASRFKRDTTTQAKYIEIALIIDHSAFSYMDLNETQLIQFLTETINGIDMLYKNSLSTRVSLVFSEIWMHKNQKLFHLTEDMTQSLLNFIEYSSKSLYKERKDVTILITASKFNRNEVSMSSSGNICTEKAVGVVQILNRFESFRLSVELAHNIAHIIGIRHDEDSKSHCDCPEKNGCLMTGKSISGKRNRFATLFSSCSKQDYASVLNSGRATCLFNKPLQDNPLSLCGNKVVDPGEICDCGSIEECEYIDPCCDPVTCSLKKEAECSTGPCCDNCKLVNTAKLCRESTGECDVAEYCNGTSGQCPEDARKLEGTVCGTEGDGYCYQGQCNTYANQCHTLWGYSAKVAEKECFEKLNMATLDPGVAKTVGNAMCSFLQCRGGEDVPKLPIYSKTEFAEHSKTFECKTASNGNKTAAENAGLVKDGTKCMANRICIDSLCVHLNAITVEPKCPSNHGSWPCSGHGICTSLHWCQCNQGWGGDDCSIKMSSDASDQWMGAAYSTPTVTQTDTVESLSITSMPTVVYNNDTKNEFYLANLPFSIRLDTYAMLVILGGVALSVFLLLLLLAVCYRRKTTSKQRRRKKSSPKNGDVIPRNLQRRCSETSLETAHRSIRFGEMPSYRDEKVQQRRIEQHQRLIANARYVDIDQQEDQCQDRSFTGDEESPPKRTPSPAPPQSTVQQSPPPAYNTTPSEQVVAYSRLGVRQGPASMVNGDSLSRHKNYLGTTTQPFLPDPSQLNGHYADAKTRGAKKSASMCDGYESEPPYYQQQRRNGGANLRFFDASSKQLDQCQAPGRFGCAETTWRQNGSAPLTRRQNVACRTCCSETGTEIMKDIDDDSMLIANPEPLKLDNIEFLLRQLGRTENSDSSFSSHEDQTTSLNEHQQNFKQPALQYEQPKIYAANKPLVYTNGHRDRETYSSVNPSEMAKKEYGSLKNGDCKVMMTTLQHQNGRRPAELTNSKTTSFLAPNNFASNASTPNHFTTGKVVLTTRTQSVVVKYPTLQPTPICAACQLPTPEMSSCDGRMSSDGSCDNNVCMCKLTGLNVNV